MTSTCRGIYGCGRTLDESLFYMNRGYVMHLCKECKRVSDTAYRISRRGERIDYAQVAREMCQNLIDEKKGSKDGK